MRKAMGFVAAAALAFGIFAMRAGSEPASSAAFDRLKSLAGEWSATDPSGKQFSDSFRLVSNNTALEETFQSEHDNQMVTLYTPDGSRLALTHYCSMGNQPHLQTPALSADASEFAFSFTSATNLASNEDKHMQALTLKIEDNDHFTETWTLHADGKDQTETFHFTRKK